MSTPTLKQILDNALRNHQHGNHAQAEAGYREVLTHRPDHPDTLHLLGLLLHQTNRTQEALGLIQRAVSIHPNTADYYNSLTAVYKAMGNIPAAIRSGERAVQLQPQFAEAWYNLGTAYSADKQYAAAVEANRKAVAIRPGYHQALMACAAALMNLDRPADAVIVYQKVLEYRPNSAEAHFGLGNAYRLQNDRKQAVELYRKAISLKPDYLEAINNLASTLQQMGRVQESLLLLRTVLEKHGEKARVHANLANVLAQDNQWDLAIESYDRAIMIQPDYHEARFNRAIALLMQGNFETGWAEYESRWLCKEFPSPPRFTDKPRWNGQQLGEKRLLVHAEQGLGDTIQFARFIPLLKQFGDRMIFQVQTPLFRLLENMCNGVGVIAHDPKAEEFDLQIPLWSLPMVLGTRLESIPQNIASFWFDQNKSKHWREQLDAIHRPGDRLNVGLVWSGSHQFIHNNIRSTDLATFAPLAQIPNVNFISLQKGPAASQASQPPAGTRLIDWTHLLDDLADTAALINQLDLVITTDTAVAHLSASMNKPTWILLMFSPDFRWLMDRTDSPWYPSAKLFRQPRVGDWVTPITQIAAELHSFSR